MGSRSILAARISCDITNGMTLSRQTALPSVFSLVLCAAGILWLIAMASSTVAVAGDRPRAVVELFTSQGCSSCPPADDILADYVSKGDVIALSWHVDYWNYLGWEDTFSKSSFTERQQRYAISFKRRGIYTPQAVVNGRAHAVGSRRGDIEKLIDTYQKAGKGLTVRLEAVHNGSAIQVSSRDVTGKATLWIVYFDRDRTVKILRGENRGRTITYHNVVRDFAMLGMVENGALDITLPLDELKRKGADSCALLLQETTAHGTPGPIVGATVVSGLGD